MNSIYYETLKKYARVIQFTVISITLTSCSYFHPHNSYAGPKHYDSQRAITAPKDGMISSPSYHDRWNPGWTRRDMWGPGMMGPTQSQRMARHWTFMHSEIPSEYRGQINTIPSNKKTSRKALSSITNAVPVAMAQTVWEMETWEKILVLLPRYWLT